MRRNHSASSVYTGSRADADLADVISAHFRGLGLLETGLEEDRDGDAPYRVPLSFPDPGNPNTVTVLGILLLLRQFCWSSYFPDTLFEGSLCACESP